MPLSSELLHEKRDAMVQRMEGLHSELGVASHPPTSSNLHPSILGSNRELMELWIIPRVWSFRLSGSTDSTKTIGLLRIIEVEVLSVEILLSFDLFHAHHSSDCREANCCRHPDSRADLLQGCHLAQNCCHFGQLLHSTEGLPVLLNLCLDHVEGLAELIPFSSHRNGLGQEVRHQTRSWCVDHIPILVGQSLLQDKRPESQVTGPPRPIRCSQKLDAGQVVADQAKVEVHFGAQGIEDRPH